MASSRESSPDPLARSLINADTSMLPNSSPIKITKATPSPSPKRPNAAQARVSTSPSKQQRTIIFSTPTKSRGASSVPGSSPWHIKVTVEAEPDEARSVSPRKSRTTTVKVPLKDEDEPRPVKRRRRTSDQDVIMSATPATAAGKRKRATPGRYTEGLPPPRRGRGRPRKSLDVPSETSIAETQEEDGAGREDAEVDAGEDHGVPTVEEPTTKKKRRQSKSLNAQDDTMAAVSNAKGNAKTSATKKVTPRQRSTKSTPSAVQTPRNTDLAGGDDAADGSGTGLKRIRGRVATPRPPHDFDASLLSSVPPSSELRAMSNPRDEPPLINDDDGPSDGNNYDTAGQDDPYCMDDGDETAMLDRSLAESEGFTMVSIESLRNHQQAEQTMTATRSPDGTPRNSSEGFHVRKSPSRKPTPKQSKPSNLSQTDQPSAPESSTLPASSASTRNSGGNPFSAFRTGTRRQLRAGLARGELLAKSEPALGRPPTSQSDLQSKSSPRTEQVTPSTNNDHARLPTPASTADNSSSPIPDAQEAIEASETVTVSPTSLRKHYDDMSWEPTTFIEARAEAREPYDEMSWEPTGQAIDIRQARTETEDLQVGDVGTVARGDVGQPLASDQAIVSRPRRRQWTEDDIWLQEADSSLLESAADQTGRGNKSRSKKIPQAAPHSRKPPKDSIEAAPDLNILLGDPDTRPTRGKIPRTWRRNSGNHFLYSDENPSPEQKKAPPTPLFVRDLRALEAVPEDTDGVGGADDNELPGTPEPTERARSPLKGILSSPTRQRELQSPPKEVRFGKDAIREFEKGVGIDGSQQYFSSDEEEEAFNADDDTESEHSRSYNDADATIYNIDTSGIDEGSTAAQTSDVRQLRQELATASTRKQGKKRSATAAQLDGSADNNIGECILRPDAKKQYPRLFDKKPAETSSKQSVLTPRRKPLPPTPRRPPPPSKSALQQTRGIFSRLTSWLYPDEPSVLGSPSVVLKPYFTPSPPKVIIEASKPALPPIKPGWNRNHYLLLDSHWRAAFPTPADVLDAEIRWHGTVGSPVSSPSRAQLLTEPTNSKPLDTLSKALQDRLGTLICSKDKLVLKVQIMHCTIANGFMIEANERGVPLLSDGTLKAPSEAELDAGGFPRRDAEGKIVRVKEECDAWYTLKRVYALWVRDIELAIEARKTEGGDLEVRWPVIAS